MHVVPPPMTGNYMPTGPNIEVDYSQFTYGPKQTQPSESETSEIDTCESNISSEPPELVSEPVHSESNDRMSNLRFGQMLPIIEEYESDSEDDISYIGIHSDGDLMDFKYDRRESCGVMCASTAQTTRAARSDGITMWRVCILIQSITEDSTEVSSSTQKLFGSGRCVYIHSQVWSRGLTREVSLGVDGGSIRVVEHLDQRFVDDDAIYKVRVGQCDVTHGISARGIRDGGTDVSLTRGRGKRKWNRVRGEYGALRCVRFTIWEGGVALSCSDLGCDMYSIFGLRRMEVDEVYRGSNIRMIITWRTCGYYWVYTMYFRGRASDSYSELWELDRSITGCVREMSSHSILLNSTHSEVDRGKRGEEGLKGKGLFSHSELMGDYSHRASQKKGIVDSGCSRHMTGNKAYLAEYQDFNGGPVAFGGSKGYITGKGIKREYSNARTPQQNRVAERKNRTLIEAARTMLADSFLPNTFWGEAVSTACYVLNRVLVTRPHNKTPYELVTDEGFLIGYSQQSKAFRVYNLETRRFEENLRITFLENKPNFAGKGPTWLFDLDYLTDSMNYQPVRSKNQANKHAGPQEANQNAGTEDSIDARDSKKEDESTQDYFVLPIWSFYSSFVKRSIGKDAGDAPNKQPDLKTNGKPVDKDDQVFLDELKRLKRQEKDANDAAEALRGAVADFTNLETVVNVSPIPTSRINSFHPSTLILRDPQSAVQTRSKVTKSSGAHAFVDAYAKKIAAVLDSRKFGFLFQVTPKTSHLSAVKRIFRYLKGKPNWIFGVTLEQIQKIPHIDMEAYSDSDCARANLDMQNMFAGYQLLLQVLWIQNQMLDYGFNFMNTKIYIDNESTTCIVKNPVHHSKIKHIAIRHYFTRDAYEKKLIQSPGKKIKHCELDLGYLDVQSESKIDKIPFMDFYVHTNDSKSRCTIFRRPSHKLFRELLPFVELDSGDTVSLNVLILGIPSPFVIVIDDMVRLLGPGAVPSITKLYPKSLRDLVTVDDLIGLMRYAPVSMDIVSRPNILEHSVDL
ncbi:ribonuclease H-like domain-containing protein [Tanacetum coccineum]